MDWIRELVRPEVRARLVAREPPAWVEPMVPVPAGQPFSDPDWLFEPQLTGVRCLAWRVGGLVRLITRDGLDATGRYPQITYALAHQHSMDFLVDGAVLTERNQLRYYLFDVLHADGYDLRELPLHQRKRILRPLLAYSVPIRYTDYRIGTGEAYWREAADHGLPGIVGKALTDVYGGTLTRSWLKFPCRDSPARESPVATAPRRTGQQPRYSPASRSPEWTR